MLRVSVRTRRGAGVFGSAAVGLMALAAAWLGPLVPSADAQAGKRAAFMRQKLDYSKDILEGLTNEDFGLIEKNARKLRTLSEASEWEVLSIPGPDYVKYSSDFQRLTHELIEEAKAKDIDGATLAYTQLTISCVKCHKFVRQQPIKRVGPVDPTPVKP